MRGRIEASSRRTLRVRYLSIITIAATMTATMMMISKGRFIMWRSMPNLAP